MKRSLLRHYIFLHIQAMISSLGTICRAPIASLMTITVIGISLALPGSLLIITENAMMIGKNFETGGQISLFLQPNVGQEQAQQLTFKLQQQPQIKKVEYLSSQQALAEFSQYSDLGKALQNLGENPLPAVITVYPIADIGIANAKKLLSLLEQLPEVDVAKLDLEWIEKLHLMLEFSKKFILALAALFASAVLLIIGNTLRLKIENQRESIAIVKLIGATDTFVRRPFIYVGSWYGIIGAIVSIAIIAAASWWLKEPILQLMQLYNSNFMPIGPQLHHIVILAIAGMCLGWIGAWLAVTRHIKRIEPN